ncbi:MAG: hypothetical protein Q9197_003336 [Variospora fuerteventurae]
MNHNDPSDGVDPEMLKHVHLVSNFNYPISAQIQVDTIVDWLLAAPSIATSVKPMVWTFLDPPPKDGVSMLVWQPLAKMGTEFSSDGYIWADAEQAFSSHSKGYTLEVYMHRCGYRYPEQVATHQRRRYRLLPGPNVNPSSPSPDPALWIVHYSQAEPTQHIPVSRIPVTPNVHAMMAQRKYFQQHGQLVRKDFMLHDRNSWPEVKLPSSNVGTQASAYPNNIISHLHRQHVGHSQARAAATNQGTAGPSPAKRARRQPPNAAEADVATDQATVDVKPTIYDLEDVSRGDLLDLLTPREISAMRYKQHHEWLGEVFRSPYDTQQIIPGELGLGRKGELEVLTKAFFNAPTEIASHKSGRVPPARIGRMEDGKADEFAKLANARIAEINTEIEKMKRQHTKRMAKLARGSELREAERMLRTGHTNSVDSRSNGGTDPKAPDADDNKVSVIQSKVEATLGKEIRKIKDAECIQKGGLQEKAEGSEDASQGYDFGDQAADLSGEIPAFPTPQDPISSMEHTPGLTAEPPAASTIASEPVKGDEEAEGADVAMGGMQEAPPAGEGEVEDWVVVDKEGDKLDASNEELSDLDAFANDATLGSTVETSGEKLGRTAADLPDFTAAAEGELDTGFAPNDFAEDVDFGNLDTAGEALSGYGIDDNMGMDDSGDLGLDDTAEESMNYVRHFNGLFDTRLIDFCGAPDRYVLQLPSISGVDSKTTVQWRQSLPEFHNPSTLSPSVFVALPHKEHGCRETSKIGAAAPRDSSSVAYMPPTPLPPAELLFAK